MAKSRQSFTSDQPDLFHQLAEQQAVEAQQAQDLDIGLEMRGAINSAIRDAKKRGFSRERIVERMNMCLPDLDRAITLRQLNAWTAHSKEFHEFPARYLPAFCWATGSTLPLLVLAHAVSHELVDKRDQAALILGQKLVEKAQITRELNTLQKTLEMK